MKKVLGILGLLACAGLAAFLRSEPGKTNPPLQRMPASLAFEATLPVAAELSFRPQSQTRYVYRFRRQIEVGGFANQVPPVVYGGYFNLDVLQATESGFTAIARAEVDGYAGKPAPIVKVSLDRTGRQLKLQAEAATDDELQQYLSVTKDLLTLWDFAAETDTLGPYEAKLETPPSSKGTLVRKKTKLKYLTPNGTEILSSAHWLRWDEALGLPAEVKGEEQTRLGRNGATLDSKTSYHLRFEGKSPAPHYSPEQLARLTHSEALLLTAGKATDHPEYAKVDWPTLAGLLQRLDTLTPGEQLAAFGDLVRLLRRDPSALAKALALLTGKDIHAGADSAIFKAIVGALATAGSPADQKALLGLYQNPACDVSGKGVILTAFTTTQAAPTAETTAFLVNEMQGGKNSDVANGAAYAVGSGLQSSNNQTAVNALMQLWQQAQQSGSVDAQLSALDAIGNSGRGEFFSVLSSVIQGNQPVLQAKATFSLRFMNTAESRGLLTTQLNSADDSIRASAASAVALAPWAEQFRAPVQSCSGHDAVSEIQKACDEILHAHPQMAGN